jgi:heme-degrading monooxygenase HmoA
MFIAMNRFPVAPGQEARFEQIWRERETFLEDVPGFVRFALLRGDRPGEYVSHSSWESRAAFEAWTASEAFVAGHRQASMQGILAGHPEVSLYEAVLTQERGERPAAAASGPEA